MWQRKVGVGWSEVGDGGSQGEGELGPADNNDDADMAQWGRRDFVAFGLKIHPIIVVCENRLRLQRHTRQPITALSDVKQISDVNSAER